MNGFEEPNFSLTSTYIIFAALAAAGALCGQLACKLLNSIPAKWLCDYDEEPSEELLGIRFGYKQSGIYTSALLAVLFAGCFAICGFSAYTPLLILITFVLALIMLSDAKFSIIPDQFTIALGVLCLTFGVYDLVWGRNVFIDKWWDIPLGAVCGGGTLLVINLLSILIFKKAGMGFGDVKLMLAAGLCLGFPMVFVSLFVGVIFAFVGIIVTLIRQLVSKKDSVEYIPFGPYLCCGVLGTVLCIRLISSVINWYASLLAF